MDSVKLKIRLPGGTVIEVEGNGASVAKTAIEIDRNLQLRQGGEDLEETQFKRPKEVLEKLIREGFFENGRTIDEIAKKLGSEGLNTKGRKTSAVAVSLSRWANEGRYGLRKEELTEKEKSAGKGVLRYYAPASKQEQT